MHTYTDTHASPVKLQPKPTTVCHLCQPVVSSIVCVLIYVDLCMWLHIHNCYGMQACCLQRRDDHKPHNFVPATYNHVGIGGFCTWRSHCATWLQGYIRALASHVSTYICIYVCCLLHVFAHKHIRSYPAPIIFALLSAIVHISPLSTLCLVHQKIYMYT